MIAAGLSASACDNDDPEDSATTNGATSGEMTGATTSETGGGATSTGSTGGCEELSCGLIHAYKFSAADALSDEVGDADATVISVSAVDQPGQIDAAWRFDAAAEDHVNLAPGMLHGLPALTVCVWFRVDELGMGTLFSWRSALDGGTLEQSFSEIKWSVISSVESGSIQANAWHLVCGESDPALGDGLRLYIDGALVGDDLPREFTNDGDDPQVVIGADADLFDASLTGHFSGLVDELYIWDRGLTAGEHAELAGLAGAAFW